MAKSLNIVKWGEFKITNILGVSINSKAWHSKDLEFSNFDNNIGIPYITRTSLNNGLYGLVVPNPKYILNPANSISLGAENAQYFLQPFRFITGNKMYYYHRDNLSLEALKFIVVCLNKSLNGVGFGFGLGLTGTRSDSRKLMLPITNTGEPDYEFMEEYIKERETKLKEQYKSHVKARVENLAKEIINDKEWKEFSIHSIFNTEKGNQNKMNSLEKGNLPLVSAKKFENGYKGFVQQNDKKVFKGNCLSLNNDGDGGAGISYYQPSVMLLDSHCTALIPKPKLNRYNLLFISIVITNQREKFGHGYAINSERLKSLKIMLPITSKGEPDYIYMENYMKHLEQKKLLEYLDYVN